MEKTIIETENAPNAIGPYSQAIKVNNTVYLSGQIPLVPDTMELISQDFTAQCHQVFNNLSAVTEAAGGSLKHIVKLTIYLSDLANFPIVNEIMSTYFDQPYPARAAVGVKALPKDAAIEIEGIMVIE
tara:strand:+ start:243 stop:626 length:384 start_codon:yes stop_codon:yes gene_type:complete